MTTPPAGEGFANPVVAGTQLVIPAINSPNYVLGVTGWAIRRDGTAQFTGLVLIGGTFTGTRFIINTAGSFFYSGTPASGNLIASITSASGTDGFGNSYQQGITSYDNTFGGVTQINGGRISLFSGVTLEAQLDQNGIVSYGASSAYSQLAAGMLSSVGPLGAYSAATMAADPSIAGGGMSITSGLQNSGDTASQLKLQSAAAGGRTQVINGGDGNVYGLGMAVARTAGTQSFLSQTQAAVTGLSVNIGTGDYLFEAWVDLAAGPNAGAGDLGYLTMGGTATISTIRAFVTTLGNNQPVTYKVQTVFGDNTAINFDLSANIAYGCVIRGHLTCTVAGTLTVNGATSSTTAGHGFTTHIRSPLILWPDAA